MKTAKEWVEECQNNHPNCPRAGKPKLPTRVIDVGLKSEITTVKLPGALAGQYLDKDPLPSPTVQKTKPSHVEHLHHEALLGSLQPQVLGKLPVRHDHFASRFRTNGMS